MNECGPCGVSVQMARVRSSRGAACAMVAVRSALAACAVAAAAAVAGCDRSGTGSARDAEAPSAELVAALNEGAAQMGQFDFTAAEATFAKALAAHPRSREAKLDLAISILNQSSDGAQERALALLRELLSSDPGDSRADYCAGLALLYLGKPADALAHFRRAAEAAPSDAHAAYYTAQCLEQTGQEAQAAPWYERSAQLDPMLRSAQLGLQRLRARAGDEAAAAEALARFEELARSPRSSIAEFKYTRMGPLGEVALPDAGGVPTMPVGPAFGELAPMPLAGLDQVRERHMLIGSADLNGDGLQDLIWGLTMRSASDMAEQGPRIESRITLGCDPMPCWTLSPNHPLERVRLVGALWGDLDNDTRVDAVLPRVTPALDLVAPAQGGDAAPRPESVPARVAPALSTLRQQADGSWTPAIIELEDSIAGHVQPMLLADLDHDGDLDIVIGHRGALSILYNRGDASFERREVLGEDPGAASRPSRVSAVAACDVDQDGDLDLLCTRGSFGTARTEVLLNEQLWRWTVDPLSGPITSLSATSIVSYLRPADGTPMIAALAWQRGFGSRPASGLEVWDFGPRVRGGAPRQVSSSAFGMATSLSVVDVVGSGQPSILITGVPDRNPITEIVRGREDFLLIRDALGAHVEWVPLGPATGYSSGTPIVVDGLGLAVVRTHELTQGPATWLPPGPGRLPLATVSFRGRTDPAQQMRTNASGIGTRADVRVSGEWVGVQQLPWSAGAFGGGQSLDPVVIGFGGAARGDFMRIDWPDRVTQTEMPVNGGRQIITETQRQISSCPVIFAWDGSRHRFVTDCLGVGGIGYLAGIERGASGGLAGIYGPPRPRESVLIGSGRALAPRTDARGGRVYDIRLGEPMEEACYLDAARLVAWTLPAGWSMTLDERMGIHGPEPTGAPRFYRTDRLMRPVKATSSAGTRDVTSDVADADLRAADPGPADPRFIGRLADEWTLELTFPRPLDEAIGDPMIIMDGWVEYPYSTTNFAMWQARATATVPTFEALDPATRTWRPLVKEYGYPAGMPRQCSFPISRESLPAGCTSIRMRTTVELYVDALAVAWSEPCDGALRTEHPLVRAEVADAGFAARTPQPQRRPEYDYSRRAPLWDCRTQPGRYTAFGVDCSPLLREIDDAVAVFAAGEEVRLSFDAGGAPVAGPGSEGASRRAAGQRELSGGSTTLWVLEVDGWCKDMDPLTCTGARMEPLPSRAGPGPPPGALDLMRKFNSRIEGGLD